MLPARANCKVTNLLNRKLPLIAAATFTAAFMTACSPASDTSAPPADENATTPTPAPENESEFHIDKPKKLRAVADDACTLLTPEQLKALGQDGSPEPDQTAFGASKCTWFSDKFSITISPDVTTGTGPEKIFEDAKENDNFSPAEVGGFPAANVDKQETQCRVDVGTAEKESFSVDYYKNAGGTPEMEDPCGYANKVAAEVLENIPNA